MNLTPENPPPTWAEHPRALRIRRHGTPLDIGVRIIDGWLRHRSGRNAAVISHYAFLSVFPLFVVFTTVLGFVLQDRPDLQAKMVDSTLNQIPIVGQELSRNPGAFRGSVVLLVIGLVTSLYAGLKAFLAVQGALDDVRQIPPWRRSNPAVIRLHGLIGVLIAGGAQVSAAVLSSLVAVTGVPGASKLLFVVGTLSINVTVLALTFRWLTSHKQTWRPVLPGAVAAGVVFTAMQLFGTIIVGRAIARASVVYGTFASVVGLLTWLSLHATVAVAGAELNQALADRAHETAHAAQLDVNEPATDSSVDDEPTSTV
jgi:uncharacterized BrkB/YihY/UPF0761 family membrane protein